MRRRGVDSAPYPTRSRIPTSRSLGLIADGDPLAQKRVPLPAGSDAGGATQATDSDPYAAASTASSAAAASTDGATAGNGAADSAANADSATATNGAADSAAATPNANGATATNGAAAHMSAPGAAASVSAPAAAAATTASAASATAAPCELYTFAKRGFLLIEDMKGRQSDVGDFLLAKYKSPCVVLRWIGRGRDCGCGC